MRARVAAVSVLLFAIALVPPLVHAAAYWLLDTLRRWLVRAGSARRQLDTLRLELLKVGGRVYQWASRVRLRLASSHPGQALWELLAARSGRA